MSDVMRSTSPDTPIEPAAVIYPVEEKVVETALHQNIRWLLFTLARAWVAEQGNHALVASDQFVYWKQGHPEVRLGPDLFLLPGEDPTRLIDSWLVWQESGPPTMALEIASKDKQKDYVQVPAKYGDLGVRELIVYDPLRGMRPRSSRLRWQVFRREGEQFLQVVATDDVRIWSTELGCYLEEEGPPEDPRVRLYVGPEGARRLPTPLEWSEERLETVQRLCEEEQRLREEEQRLREGEQRLREEEQRLREEEQRLREEEQRRREAAEAEVRRLRAELDRAREADRKP